MLDWAELHSLCRDPACDLLVAKRRFWLDRVYADQFLCKLQLTIRPDSKVAETLPSFLSVLPSFFLSFCLSVMSWSLVFLAVYLSACHSFFFFFFFYFFSFLYFIYIFFFLSFVR